MILENAPLLNTFKLRESGDYPKDFYSFDDKVEILENDNIEIHFDSLQIKDFDKYLGSDDFILRSDLHNIVLELPRNNIASFFTDTDSIENTWYKVKLSENDTGSPVSLFVESNNEEVGDVLYLSNLKEVERLEDNNSVLSKLKSIFSLDSFDISSESSIVEALTVGLIRERYSVYNVYNVGQGNLTAICNLRNIPLVYIDLGGGCYGNSHTYSEILRLCYTAFSPIILTHWDIDHLWTAHKNYKKFSERDWIVPKQPLSVTQMKFLKRLLSQGNRILIFPNTVTRIDTPLCTIVKCNGASKNNSGLAVFIKSRPRRESELIILNPGDCSYQNIGHINDTDLLFGCLIATHHGAGLHINSTPPTAHGPYRIVYSFGLGNSYSHPRLSSIKDHIDAGWGNSLTTLNGHISFRKIRHSRKQPCSNLCDLEISQGFR